MNSLNKILNVRIKSSWTGLGSYLELISFEKSDSPSWEDYLKDKSEFFEKHIYPKGYTWDNVEEFTNEMKERYADFIWYLNGWSGILKIGEKFTIKRTDNKDIIRLITPEIENIEGISEDELLENTIELWKYKEYSFLQFKVKTYCDLFTFYFQPTSGNRVKIFTDWIGRTYEVLVNKNDSTLTLIPSQGSFGIIKKVKFRIIR